MASKRKKKKEFSIGKEIRAIARERVGVVKSSQTIKSKKDKFQPYKHKDRDLMDW